MKLVTSWSKVFGNLAGRTLNWRETLTNFSSPWHVLLYTPLLVPETRVIGDVVWLYLGEALENFTAERDALATRRSALSPSEFEELVSNYNWVELPALIGCGPVERGLTEEEQSEAWLQMANAIKLAWEVVLRGRHPERLFVVRILDESSSDSAFGVDFREVL